MRSWGHSARFAANTEVQAIVPTTLAAIRVRSVGSHTSTSGAAFFRGLFMSCNGHASTEPRGPRAGQRRASPWATGARPWGRSAQCTREWNARGATFLREGREKIGGDFVCASAPSPRTPPFDRNTEYRSLQPSSPRPCRESRKVRAIREPPAPTARGHGHSLALS